MTDFEKVTVKKPDGGFEEVSLPAGMSDADKASALSKLYVPAKRTAFQQQAASRGLGINVAQNAATMDEEISNAKGKAASDIGKAGVLGAAALSTGGLAAGPAAAMMGGAGAIGSLLGENVKAGYGSTDIPQSGPALARRMGLEAAISAGGEGAMRLGGQILKKVGTELFPAIVMRSAAKAEAGQQALVRVQQDSFDQLRSFVRDNGNPTVDIGDNIKNMFSAVRDRATGTSQAFKEATKPVFAKLWKAAEQTGGSLEKQPLDALMEIKTDLSHIAYKVKGMNSDEMVALRNLADGVESKIKGALTDLGGDAANKVYSNYKAFTEQIRADNTTLDVAETGLKKLLGKAAGYVPGVDTAIDGIIRGKVAPWALEHMFSNPKTAGLVKDAMSMAGKGDHVGAQRAFEAAVNTSDVGSLLKDFLKGQNAVAPNAFSGVQPDQQPVAPAGP